MAESVSFDSVRLHRSPVMFGAEMVFICCCERSFPERSHGEHVLGAVAAGAEMLTVAGRSQRVGDGNVLRLYPIRYATARCFACPRPC